MSTFPSIVSTISTPTATDKLNSPSHSSIEAGQNDAISKLETFVGTLSSAAGTLMYDVRATGSDGGGHVQGANKGGTGQTAYTKGDVLVAQSASVLSKLAIGTNNQVLTADSNQNTGVKWAGVANAIDIQNQTYTYARASVMSGSVYGVKLSENPSVLSDGLGLVVKFPAVPTSSLMALQVFTSSSGSVSALIKKQNLSNPDTTDIVASMIGVLKFDSVSSVFQMVSPAPSIVSLPYVNTTSAQSVAGIKIFASLPQVGSNPSADVELARKAYVDSSVPAVTWKNGTITRDMTAASGAVTTAHGLGRTPNFIRITVNQDDTVYISPQAGTYNGTTIALIYKQEYNDGTGDSWSTSSAKIIYSGKLGSNPSEYSQSAVPTFDATNITLTWTKVGSPTGTMNILWEAF